MADKQHVFNRTSDSEKLAMDVMHFLKKWGLWYNVQIFSGGKSYVFDSDGGILIRDEEHPEINYANPEMLFDMIFDGPLTELLNGYGYEVDFESVSKEAKDILISRREEFGFKQAADFEDEFIAERSGWDPAKHDSYEEWLELNEFNDMNDFSVELEDIKVNGYEFSSREEYEDYILKCSSIREHKAWEYFKESLGYDEFFDKGKISSHIVNEFDELFERYGLWYELGTNCSLTTYRN